jgi:hypothetical protein
MVCAEKTFLWREPYSHRVGRVLNFFSSRRNWDSPNPSPAGECAPPPRGGAHSLAREGLGESQFRRGDIHCGTLYIYVLCAYSTCWRTLGKLLTWRGTLFTRNMSRELVYKTRARALIPRQGEGLGYKTRVRVAELY